MAVSKYKKGSMAIEVVFIIFLLFVLGIGIPTVYNIYSDLSPELNETFAETNSTEAQEALEVVDNSYPGIFDGMIVLAFIFVLSAAIITSFFLDTHPIFFVISLFFLIILVGVAAFLGNSIEEITEDDYYSSFQSNFPMTYWLVTHLLQVSLVSAALILIALYGKSRFDG